MPDIAIECRGVWKSYRIYHQRSHTLKEKVLSRRNRYEDFWALKGVDLEIPTGTTFGIIGANGSGKSTFMKCLARILTPNRGRLTVHGTVSPLLELGTGFHPELTGRENLFLGGSLLGQSRSHIQSRFGDIVDFAGIGEFIDAPVKNYSSGMYARLAFALAINVDPEILLVDEVLSVGDESFQMRCYQRIAELRMEGRTIVMVSHNLDTIKSMCSHAVWLEHGEVALAGESHDVAAGYLAEVHKDASQTSGLAPSGTREGTGEVEVTGVTFLDKKGVASGAFRTNEPLTVRVRYKTEGRVTDVACGIAVLSAQNLSYLFGHSSKAAGMSLDLEGEGTIEFTLPNLPLLQGSYVVTVALEGTGRVYDLHDRRYSFLVFENPDLPLQAGMVRVDGSWTVTPSPVAA
jgi:ABC-type polysaccharide/polyol phosphate transport system ATPase subunit